MRCAKFGVVVFKASMLNCRGLICYGYVILCFLFTGLKIFRETSFQQVLLSSSGPKENISISKFNIPLIWKLWKYFL